MKVTLKRVETKALEDATFWRKLRADPDQTLADNKLELSAADSRRLREILDIDGKEVKIDLANVMLRARRSKRPDRLFWMAMWSPDGLGLNNRPR